MSEVETRYWEVSASKLALEPMMMGGVMMPASIDRACWKPRSRARKTGMRSFRPKKGALRRGRRMKGRVGRKRKA